MSRNTYFTWNFHKISKTESRLSSICYQKNDSRQHSQVFLKYENLLKENTWDFVERLGKDIKELEVAVFSAKVTNVSRTHKGVLNLKLLTGWIKQTLAQKCIIYFISKVFTTSYLIEYKVKGYIVICVFAWGIFALTIIFLFVIKLK